MTAFIDTSLVLDTALTGQTAPVPAHTVADRLAAVDWDFRARVAHSDIEGIHPYPAKFVTELPAALLDIVPIQAGTAVFDPFCGSGATWSKASGAAFLRLGSTSILLPV
jgi:hypothetical protein